MRSLFPLPPISLECLQALMPKQECKKLVSITARGFQEALDIRADHFTYGGEAWFSPHFHSLVTGCIEHQLRSACEAKQLQSHANCRRSKKRNAYPFMEYLSDTGLYWHFKYFKNSTKLPPVASFRSERALCNTSLFLDFQENMDGTKYYRPDEGRAYAILAFGYSNSAPVFLQVVFPDAEYMHVAEAFNLTSALMAEFRLIQKQAQEEIIPEPFNVAKIKKSAIAKQGA